MYSALWPCRRLDRRTFCSSGRVAGAGIVSSDGGLAERWVGVFSSEVNGIGSGNCSESSDG